MNGTVVTLSIIRLQVGSERFYPSHGELDQGDFIRPVVKELPTDCDFL